jgi:hypothetical protein
VRSAWRGERGEICRRGCLNVDEDLLNVRDLVWTLLDIRISQSNKIQNRSLLPRPRDGCSNVPCCESIDRHFEILGFRALALEVGHWTDLELSISVHSPILFSRLEQCLRISRM